MDDDEFEDYVGSQQIVEQNNDQVQQVKQQAGHEEQVNAIPDEKVVNESEINHASYAVQHQQNSLICQQHQTDQHQQQQRNAKKQEQNEPQGPDNNKQHETEQTHQNELNATYQNEAFVVNEHQSVFEQSQQQQQNQSPKELNQFQTQQTQKQHVNYETVTDPVGLNIQENLIISDQHPHINFDNQVIDMNGQFNDQPSSNFSHQNPQQFIEQSFQQVSNGLSQAEFSQFDEAKVTEVNNVIQEKFVQQDNIDAQIDIPQIHQTEHFTHQSQNHNQNITNNQQTSYKSQVQQIQQIPQVSIAQVYLTQEIQQIKSSNSPKQQQPEKIEREEQQQEDDDEFGDFQTYQEPEHQTPIVAQTTETNIQPFNQSQSLPQQLQHDSQSANSTPSISAGKSQENISQQQTIYQPNFRNQPTHAHSIDSPQKQLTISPNKSIQQQPVSEHFVPISPKKPLTLEDELLTFLDSLPNYKRICLQSFYDTS